MCIYAHVLQHNNKIKFIIIYSICTARTLFFCANFCTKMRSFSFISLIPLLLLAERFSCTYIHFQ